MGQHLIYHYQTEWFAERQTAIFSVTLREPAPAGSIGAVIPGSSLATCVLTLYDPSTSANSIVNSIEQTSIKNVGRGAISAAGILTLTLTPADMVILVAAHPYELRRALIEITWPTTPTKEDAYQIDFVVENISRRPYVAP